MGDHGYGAGYGGYGQPGYIAGPGGAPGTMVYTPIPVWETVLSWLVAFTLIILFIWGLCRLWSWSERNYWG